MTATSALPFGDATFEPVVSSLAIHNVPSAAGGRVALVDLAHTADYVRAWRSSRRRGPSPVASPAAAAQGE